MMNRYVLGFLFNSTKARVALIRDDIRLNGFKGSIEVGELPHAAMMRAFEEKTEVEVSNWECFAILTSSEWEINCFRAVDTFALEKVSATADEDIQVISCGHLAWYTYVSKLAWLIPMAIVEPRLMLVEY